MFNTSGIEFWVNMGVAVAGIFGGIMVAFGYIKRKYGEMLQKKEDPKELCISSRPDQKHSHIH